MKKVRKYEQQSYKETNIIGKAFAGHASRGGDLNNPKLARKAAKYNNVLSDWITLLIAEKKANIDKQQ